MKEDNKLSEIEEKNNKGVRRKENKLGLIVLCISILICIISISYAIWT